MPSPPPKKMEPPAVAAPGKKFLAALFYKLVDRKTAHAGFEKGSAFFLAARLLWLRLVCSLTNRPLVVVSLVEHCGDIVACEPVARYLRTQFPDMYLVWICTGKYVELLRYHPDINKVAKVTCLTSWLRVRGLKLGHQQIDLQINGRFCLTCRNPIINRTDDQKITVENYYEFGALLPTFCTAAGLPALTESPRFHFPAGLPARTDSLNLPEKFIVFHCRSNDLERDWDAEKWRQLKEQLVKKFGVPIVEVGLKNILTEPNDGAFFNLCGRLSLLETAGVIARATLFVGVDSGPAHIANAVRCPGIVLLGRYRRFAHRLPFSGFFAEDGTIVRTTGALSSLSVAEVFDAIQKKLSATMAEPQRGHESGVK